jgi:hypothetical protein
MNEPEPPPYCQDEAQQRGIFLGIISTHFESAFGRLALPRRQAARIFSLSTILIPVLVMA